MSTTRTYQFDVDTKRYLNRVNTYRSLNGLANIQKSDAADIDNFVIGLKDLGVWYRSICFLLRSQHNIGTGSQVFSIGGQSNIVGNLVNSPNWTNDGIDTSPTGSYIVIPKNFLNGTNSVVGQTGSMLAVFANFSTNFGIISNRGASGNFWVFGTRNSTTQIYSVANATGGGNQIVTKAGLNTNNLQFASWRMDRSANRFTTRWNGTNAQSAVVSGGTASSKTDFEIGREIAIQYALKCAFCMTVEDLAITDAQHDSLETLTKQTIGKGLNLP
jgi:hypothetical protein